MDVLFKKLTDDATIPTFGSKDAAGIDLYATRYEIDYDRRLITYYTGIAMQIAGDHTKKYVGEIHPRSSITKKPLMLWNSTGIIDYDYRGELIVKFRYINDGVLNEKNIYKPGDRIAQIIIKEIPFVYIVEAKELNDTERGTAGFGSTGD